MSVMQAQEVLKHLEAIDSNLGIAIDALAHLRAPDGTWPEALRKAAGTLQNIQFGESLRGERSSVEQALRRLAEQARTARTLLDSAAAFYFGRILSSCSMECGYLADGGANSVHYGCLRIEG